MNRPAPENISLADFLIWEQQQADRYEWIDGAIVRCAGGSDEHAAIISNLNAAFHTAVGTGPCFVRGSDRKVVPRGADGYDLGSFYADLFVSCASQDRRGEGAHFPMVVIEVLSKRIGEEFTRKKRAYLGSAKLIDYLIIDSTSRYMYRFSWKLENDRRRLVTCEQRRGLLCVPALGLTISFDQIYAGTDVPAILHPITGNDEDESEIILDQLTLIKAVLAPGAGPCGPTALDLTGRNPPRVRNHAAGLPFV
jgi:Uma2 family endonuclease